MMMLYRFSRWRPLRRNFTSGFRSGDVARYRRSMSISKSNFSYNSICGWEITISGWKNKRPPYWNFTSGFDFYHITVLGMSFCTIAKFHPNQTIRSGVWRYIDFQDGGRCDAILLPVLDEWRCSFWKVNKPNFVYSYNSIRGWDITIRFGKN